jgi:hypothetical protein
VAAVVAGGLMLVVLLALGVVVGPRWIVGQAEGLSVVERLRATNDVRATLLQALGGLLALGGVALGAAMTLRQVRANRDGQLIDLFTRAIEQLASERLSVRHGGIYALEQLAELSPRYRGHAHALITAFIRQHAPWPPLRPEEELAADRARLQGALSDDVGAALSVLSRRLMIVGDAVSLLEHVDLREADLEEHDFTRAVLRYSTLAGARLAGARLVGADLRGTDLSGADLTSTDLRGAVADETTTWPDGLSRPGPSSSAHTCEASTA